MAANFTAERISRAGQTPVWKYRGTRIAKVYPDFWGRGYIFSYEKNEEIRIVHCTTLSGAKADIDRIKGMN